MQMIRKPYPWACILASFAMALGASTNLLVKLLGHDGSKIVFPDLPEPMCRRGFHVQELVQLAWHLGYCVTPIEILPVIASTGGDQTLVLGDLSRFEQLTPLIEKNSGVLTGRGANCNHAVAFHKGQVLDSEGPTYPFSREQCQIHGFFPSCIWLITKRDGPKPE